MIEELARIPVEVEYASEFRYRNPIVTDKTLCIVISQSGETADTLAAMREAKRRGAQDARTRERRRLDDRARGRRRHLPARRPGDRRRVDEGVHEPGHRARAADAQAGAPAQPVGGARASEIIAGDAGAAGADPDDPRSRDGDREDRRGVQGRARTSCTSAAATTSRPRSRARSS